jgi:dTDP-4-amino-4,6-dideoxygalactose transaminase
MNKNTKISFFDYTDLFKKNETELLRIFEDVSKKGAFIMQEELSVFESKLENYTCINHAIGVANATDALQQLLKAGGLSQGDEVIFCNLS